MFDPLASQRVPPPSPCPFIFTLTTLSPRTFPHSSSSLCTISDSLSLYFHRHRGALRIFSISSCSSLSPPSMADSQRHKHGGVGSRKQQQPSRLQMRAPSSLQVNRSCDWNVAIPLLSPLASSPPPVKIAAPATEREREEARQMQQRQQGGEPENVVFKKWQHPAAPFCYESSSVAPPFFRSV